MTNENKINYVLDRLSRSTFRTKFNLKEKDKEYVIAKGMDVIRSHTYDFITNRVSHAVIPNDGKQTPMKGHPTFLAQHATATCCRGCIEKWHGFAKGKELSEEEKNYLCDVIITWINRQMNS